MRSTASRSWASTRSRSAYVRPRPGEADDAVAASTKLAHVALAVQVELGVRRLRCGIALRELAPSRARRRGWCRSSWPPGRSWPRRAVVYKVKSQQERRPAKSGAVFRRLRDWGSPLGWLVSHPTFSIDRSSRRARRRIIRRRAGSVGQCGPNVGATSRTAPIRNPARRVQNGAVCSRFASSVVDRRLRGRGFPGRRSRVRDRRPLPQSATKRYPIRAR